MGNLVKTGKHMLVYSNLGFTIQHSLCAGVPGHRCHNPQNVDTAMTVTPEDLLTLGLQIVPVVREPYGYGHHLLHFLYAGISAHGALQNWAQGLAMEER